MTEQGASMTRALIIVDVQNDFCEGGALAVTGGAAVAARITDYLDQHVDDYDLVVASRDWHDADNDNGGHFAAGDPDYVDTWPRHCVAGTPGADYHPDLDLNLIDLRIEKGQGRPSYSAFEGTIRSSGRGIRKVLRGAGVTDIDVVGIATDYCVKATALDAVGFGATVRVIEHLTAGVAPESTADALQAMRAAGVEVVS